jgi:hypothetical protein
MFGSRGLAEEAPIRPDLWWGSIGSRPGPGTDEEVSDDPLACAPTLVVDQPHIGRWSPNPTRSTMPPRAAVGDLRHAVVDRGRAEEQMRAAVARARVAGASGSVLAATLGTSRQAAQKRFGSPT